VGGVDPSFGELDVGAVPTSVPVDQSHGANGPNPERQNSLGLESRNPIRLPTGAPVADNETGGCMALDKVVALPEREP